MNFENIYTDFEKRYGVQCKRAYFIGKPIIFFDCPGLTVGTAVSAGAFVSAAQRDDGRVIVQFSDNTKFLNSNILDFEYYKDEKIFDLLMKVQRYGVKVGGVRLLLSRNTKLYMPDDMMLLSSLDSFCTNVPEISGLITHFNNFEKNIISVSSRCDTAVVFDGQNARYAPFYDSDVKVVLCNIKEKINGKISSQEAGASDAVSALETGDFENFGNILNSQTEKYFANNKREKKSKQLFEATVKLGDAYGSGVLEDGGIFSVVKNSRVDAFMHNLGAEYERYFGGYPDFYVTRAEDSGIGHDVPQQS